MAQADIPAVVRRLRSTFDSGGTRPLTWRRDQLGRLRQMITDLEADAFAAVKADLGKPPFEAWIGESSFILSEIDFVSGHLARWMKPRKVRTPMVGMPGSSLIAREPKGVVLIIGPWNYPFMTTVLPLVGALAAGNCAVLKPSEAAPATSSLLARGVREYLDTDAVSVVEGAVPEATALLAERFDHILFTGGTETGRIVMQAAAKNLTPVTLELGGKSPCIVDRDTDLRTTGRRIAWGKFFNCGQTCVAPDYVLAHRDVEEELIEALRTAVRDFYGAEPESSPDYARIVNEVHFERLTGLLDSGEIVTGGRHDKAALYIEPTILRNVPGDCPVMMEEIFGPILPVLPVADIDEAVSFVNARPHPLALYLFSRSRSVQQEVVERTTSGGVCINDVIMHLTAPTLPFGGVGDSGMGAYRGRASFETFSHSKSVMRRSLRFDVQWRYPPYSDKKLKWMKRVVSLG